MVDFNLGSVATRVINRVEGITTTISGALIDIADEQRLFMEEETGLTIGSVGIAEKFQPALVALTAAQALDLLQVSGTDITGRKLGDFEITQAKTTDKFKSAAVMYREDGLKKLRSLGKRIRFRQVLG